MPNDQTSTKGNTNNETKPTVGRTYPDLISEYPKTSIAIGVIVFLVIAFFVMKGYGIEFSNFKINPPTPTEKTDSTEETKKKEKINPIIGEPVLVITDYENKLNTLKKKKIKLKTNLEKAESEIEKRVIQTNLGLLEIEIEDIEKLIKENSKLDGTQHSRQ